MNGRGRFKVGLLSLSLLFAPNVTFIFGTDARGDEPQSSPSLGTIPTGGSAPTGVTETHSSTHDSSVSDSSVSDSSVRDGSVSDSPVRSSRKSRGRAPREKEAEGTQAPNRFDSDIIFKSRYELNGKPLEVDTD